MKTIVRSLPFPQILWLVAPMLAGVAIAVEPSDISLPTARAEVLSKAGKMLGNKNPSTDVPNPFYPVGFEGNAPSSVRPADATTPAAAVVAPRSASALLEAIAGNLKVSGSFVIGGQPTLVFGQKRVKAGSLMTVTYEGTEYTLEIVSIDRTHFTLRLNREEFTRPIK